MAKRKRRFKRFACIALPGILLVLVAGTFFRIRTHHSWGYTCRLCGATWNKEISYVLGIPVWYKKSKIYRQRETDAYEEYIGEPHRHQWAGGGHSVDYGNIFGYGIHSDGMHAVPPYPIFQPHLTRTALHVAVDLMDEPTEFRRRVFREILRCTTPEAYRQVRDTYNKSLGSDREQVWREWLASRMEGAGRGSGDNLTGLY